MNYRLMFTINAVILAVFGVLLMLVPEAVLVQFGGEVYVITVFIARFFGSALLLGGLLLWVLKDAIAAKMQKNIAYILGAFSVGGFAMTVLGMTSIGVLRKNAWALLVVYGFFALTYGYMLFLQPKSSESKARGGSRKPKNQQPTASGLPE